MTKLCLFPHNFLKKRLIEHCDISMESSHHVESETVKFKTVYAFADKLQADENQIVYHLRIEWHVPVEGRQLWTPIFEKWNGCDHQKSFFSVRPLTNWATLKRVCSWSCYFLLQGVVNMCPWNRSILYKVTKQWSESKHEPAYRTLGIRVRTRSDMILLPRTCFILSRWYTMTRCRIWLFFQISHTRVILYTHFVSNWYIMTGHSLTNLCQARVYD